jgi:hypothetical protein
VVILLRNVFRFSVFSISDDRIGLGRHEVEVVAVVTYVCQVWIWTRKWTGGAWEQSGENVHEITIDE